MPRRHASRRGFTLAEIMVVLAVLAALAAVLLPVVTNQLKKSQVTRVVGDLTNIRTGAEAFVADVHRYPGDVEDLSAAITGADKDVDGAIYPTGLLARWDGPYIDKVMDNDSSFETGFGARVLDSLTVITHSNNVPYLTILVRDITQFDFYEVDRSIDGDTAIGAGRLRWASDTLKYLALPKN